MLSTVAVFAYARAGTTPHQWLTSQRLILAQELLERTSRGIEQIAADCGLAPMMLRRHFTRRWASPPGLPAPLQPASRIEQPRRAGTGASR